MIVDFAGPDLSSFDQNYIRFKSCLLQFLMEKCDLKIIDLYVTCKQNNKGAVFRDSFKFWIDQTFVQ